MEKRALLAVILSFMVLFIYSQYFAPRPDPDSIAIHGQTAPSGTQSVSSDEAPSTTPPSEPPPAASVQESQPIETEQIDVIATPDNLDKQEIVVESELYRAVLSNKGANIVHFTLKKYRDSVKDDSNLYEMIWQGQSGERFPLTLIFQNSLLTSSFQKGSYEADIEEPHLFIDEQQQSVSVSFNRTDKSGIFVQKTLTFHHDSYLIDCDIAIENKSNKQMNVTWTLIGAEGIGPEGKETSRYVHFGPIFMVHERNKENLEKVKVKNLSEEEISFKTGLRWCGIGSPYFCLSLIPEGDQTYYGSAWSIEEDIPIVALKTPLIEADTGFHQEFNTEFYIGPKERSQLKKAPHNLLSIIDYGIFSIIALPLFKALLFFYSYLKNWGLAIIVLTVIIKILFYPLTRSSFQSMEKMKVIQPEMNEIRSKYKDDPNRLNKEIWALYRKHKVNPMGSCFPTLLQIPVFIALYNVLYVSIELRHSSFLYIPDLSAYDPYYISPILMGASMLLQQQMTPVMGDPKQAQLMKLMPVVFTVMFIYFPSGLVIYWLVNNLITIGQQLIIRRKSSPQLEPTEEEPVLQGKKSRKKKGAKHATKH